MYNKMCFDPQSKVTISCFLSSTLPDLRQQRLAMDRSLVPLKIYRTFYNSFYAIRFHIRVRDQAAELIFGRSNPQLSCRAFPANATPSFVPVLQELFCLFAQYGVTNFGRCWSDPLPIVEVEFEDLDFSVKSLLESLEEIEPQAWKLFCDAFRSESISPRSSSRAEINCSPCSSSQTNSGNCRIEVLFLTPNHYRREVDVLPVTLANYRYMEKQMEASLVFDFPSAMQQFQKREIPPSVKGIMPSNRVTWMS